MGRAEVKEYLPDSIVITLMDDVRCTARNRPSGTRPGERCGQPSMRGQQICRIHGGKTPRHQAAAARRLTVAEHERELDVLERPTHPLADPVAELGKAAALTVWMRDKAYAMWEGLEKETEKNGSGVTVVHEVIKLAERATERTNKVLVEMVKLNLEARRAELEAQQMASLVSALDAALDAVGLKGEDRRKAVKVISDQLAVEAEANTNGNSGAEK
jgi:hypothetical protein